MLKKEMLCIYIVTFQPLSWVILKLKCYFIKYIQNINMNEMLITFYHRLLSRYLNSILAFNTCLKRFHVLFILSSVRRSLSEGVAYVEGVCKRFFVISFIRKVTDYILILSMMYSCNFTEVLPVV